jgi:diamine N-acetyltransferase
MITIKKVGPESVSLVRELTYKVWPQTYSTILSIEQIDYMMDMFYSTSALKKQMGKEKHQFIVAFEESTPLAFASYSPKTQDDHRTFRLHKIYILPSLQGRGLGKLLIDYIIGDILPKGAAILELNVNRYNPAKKFYEKLGFAVSSEEDIDIGNGYYMNDYVMSKSIKN